MLFIFKILLICSLVRLLTATDQPFLCSSIYAGGIFVMGMLFGASFSSLLVITLIRFGLSSLYFWLLDRFSDGFLWWLILLIGLPLILV